MTLADVPKSTAVRGQRWLADLQRQLSWLSPDQNLIVSPQKPLGAEAWQAATVSGVPVGIHGPARLALVGPAGRPGANWCWECHLLAVMDAGRLPARSEPPPEVSLPLLWLTALAIVVTRAAATPPPAVYLLDGQARVSAGQLRHRCSRCLARTAPVVPPRPIGGAARTPLSDLPPLDALVSGSVGPLLQHARVTPDGASTPTCTVQIANALHGGRVFGIGRARDYSSAAKLAQLEALERYCGVSNRTERTLVRASYTQLGERALHPDRVGTYPAESLTRPDFPCVRFDPDESRFWTDALDVGRGTLLLVPADLAFYGYVRSAPHVVFESSSGCAIGSSPGDALLFGALEAIERDALLRWWYGDHHATPVPLPVTEESGWLLDRLTDEGTSVEVFSITAHVEVPVALTVATGPYGLLCGFGAERSWPAAVHKALGELSTLIGVASGASAEERARAADLARWPEQIQTVDDHVLYALTSEAQTRVRNHLTRAAGRPSLRISRPVQSLDDLLTVLGRAGHDLIAVDLSPPWLAEHHLACMKAIVPGLVPMHFGAFMQRQVVSERFVGHIDTCPHPFG